MPAPPLPANANVERILAAAWVLFQQQGYRGAAVDEICRRCAITKPTLYYYFGDKEGLYVQVIVRQLQGYRALLEQPAALSGRLTLLAARMLEQFSTEMSAMFNDMRHIHDNRNLRLLNSAFASELLGPLTALFRAEMARGALRPGVAEFYAWAFLGLVSAFTARERRVLAPAELARQLVTLFVDGAAQPAAPR
jgi:AcrR family transcriptional regulator